MSVAKVKPQYIYRFYNASNQCLYVGKTIHLKPRFLQHKQKEWWNEVTRIEYAQLPEGREFMVDIYEVYYINHSKPLYNAKDINVKYMKWSYPLLEFKDYNIKLINGQRQRKYDNFDENLEQSILIDFTFDEDQSGFQ